MVTSHDVARVAGVSQPTVSRALRDHPDISVATRQRVKAAAAQLHYVPSQLGRSLSTRTTRRIGIVAAELTNPFYPALLAPLHEALGRAGYSAILVTGAAAESPEVAALVDGSVDGVVLTASTLDSALPDVLRRHGLPVVLLNRETDSSASGSRFDSCVPDNAGGAALVADLVTGLGHRRIGVISGPTTISTSRDRLAAFAAGVAAAGVPLDPDLIRSGPYAPEAGAAALIELLAGSRPPTAVFCANDVLALGALNAARRRGVIVPDRLTLVGFDDIPLAGWDVLDLTTVRVELASMADAAVRLLLRRIAEPDAAVERVVSPVSLAHRGTHGAPA